VKSQPSFFSQPSFYSAPRVPPNATPAPDHRPIPPFRTARTYSGAFPSKLTGSPPQPRGGTAAVSTPATNASSSPRLSISGGRSARRSLMSMTSMTTKSAFSASGSCGRRRVMWWRSVGWGRDIMDWVILGVTWRGRGLSKALAWARRY
jgi:hypothetical protein